MPKPKNNFLFIIFLSLLIPAFTACDNNDSAIDTRAIKEEIGNRKIKKVSELQILEASFVKGRELIDTLSVQKNDLKHTGESDTLDKQYRLGAMQPLVESLQQANKAEIKKVIATDLNSATTRKPEKEIFEAYQYNVAQGLKVDDNVQIMDRYVFYSSPILDSGELKGMWSIYFDKSEIVKAIQ